MQTIEYFYSAHSIYAYLGSARLMAIAAEHDRRLVHKPMDLDRVLAGCGSVAFAERSLDYRNYFFNRELERWAEFRGVKTLGRRPRNHHHSPDLANGVLIAAIQQGRSVDSLAHRMLEAHWAEEADLADADTLRVLAGETGLDGDSLLSEARSKAVLDAYDANTREAIARSVFGSPTYFVDGDMFYGQDRLEHVARALERPFQRRWPSIQQ